MARLYAVVNLFDGMNFQGELEKKAYEVGKGKIPTQKYIDFKKVMRKFNLLVICWLATVKYYGSKFGNAEVTSL